jgi:hypothetical protein
MDDYHILAPKNGSAVGHGQYACVDETCQRNRPRLACAYGCLRPGRLSVLVHYEGACIAVVFLPILALQVFLIKVKDW